MFKTVQDLNAAYRARPALWWRHYDANFTGDMCNTSPPNDPDATAICRNHTCALKDK